MIRRGPDGKIQPVLPDESAPKAAGDDTCQRKVLCVGSATGFRTIALAAAAARDGDIIEIAAGTYKESVAFKASKLIIRGVGGRPQINCTGVPLAEDKACLLLSGDEITVENLEIVGATVSAQAGENGACLRNGPNRSFTIRRVICHASQNGILSDGGTILVENSEFYDNGWTGLTHNVYFSGACPSVTVRGSTFRDARIGHEFKSRCKKTTITDSTFRSVKGSRAIDIPDGGDTQIYGGLITKGSGAQNDDIVGFAPENCRVPAPMRIVGTRIVNNHPSGRITNYDNCQGQPIVLEGVIFEQKPPKLSGYIITR